MDPVSPPLLALPSEIRHQIWSLVFEDQSIAAFNSLAETFPHRGCEACTKLHADDNDDRTDIQPWDKIWPALLTCRQIHTEATHLLHNTMTLHVTDPNTLERIRPQSSNSRPTSPSNIISIRSKLKHITLYLHLNDESRHTWISILTRLPLLTFNHLESLTIHNHMRPPISYDRLVDVIYLAGPLVTMPRAAELKQTLYFNYVREEIMFESPFLGEIRCADAIEEHEAVIRGVLANEDFKVAADARDLNGMTSVLLGVAREHEQPWLERLQARRMVELATELDMNPEEAEAWLDEGGEAVGYDSSDSEDDGGDGGGGSGGEGSSHI